MRRIITLILVLLCATLGVTLIAGSMISRKRTVLLDRAGPPGVHDFLVAERGSLVLARQGVAQVTGAVGDVSEFGQYKLSVKLMGAGPKSTFKADSISITGSQLTLIADPITPNIQRGFLWLNVTGPIGPPAGTFQITCRAVGAPMWVLGLPLFLPAAVVLVRARRCSRRRQRGLCAACGYDLRASPERCPECGEVSSQKVEVHRTAPE